MSRRSVQLLVGTIVVNILLGVLSLHPHYPEMIDVHAVVGSLFVLGTVVSLAMDAFEARKRRHPAAEPRGGVAEASQLEDIGRKLEDVRKRVAAMKGELGQIEEQCEAALKQLGSVAGFPR